MTPVDFLFHVKFDLMYLLEKPDTHLCFLCLFMLPPLLLRFEILCRYRSSFFLNVLNRMDHLYHFQGDLS
jgi:hypothetical protein